MVSSNAKEQSIEKSGMAISTGCGETNYFPYISIKQSAKVLPTFVIALEHSIQESFSSEDLDKIQPELEILLSKVALRFKVLRTDYDLLDKDEKRFERRGKHAEKNPLSGKRKREEKKTKTAVLKYPNLKSNQFYFGHYQKNSYSDPTDFLSQQLKQQKILVPKNDILNKFWLSVEPFCMPITNEDLRLLDDLLDQYCGRSVPAIPDLGKDYNIAYTVDNMKELNVVPHVSFPNLNMKDTEVLQKSISSSDVYPTGLLTQHVVSALMEEDLKSDMINSYDNYNNLEINCYKPFDMKNEIAVEKCIRKELIAHGMLENEFSGDEEDEVLDEIRRLSSDISAVSVYNQQALKKLREICVCEIARFHFKSNLDIVDTDILESYKNFTFPKSRPKVLSTQEQRTILRITSEQKSWADKLEENNLNFTV